MNANKIINKNQKGFTIIELMVATTIFSIVLMVILASFLQVGRMFYKGVSVNNTTESARNLVDDIANDVRLSSDINTGNLASPTAKKYFCVGSHRYTFILGTKVLASDVNVNSRTLQHGMLQDNVNSCQDPSNVGTQPQQLLGPDMQLNVMDFSPNANGVSIHAHVVFYGFDDTVFDSNCPITGVCGVSWHNTGADPNKAAQAPDAFCSGNLLSTQFCAVADFKTLTTTSL